MGEVSGQAGTTASQKPALSLLAATHRLVADEAVGAVIRAGKEKQTILALSKSDLVTDAQVDSMIVRRVLGEDSDCMSKSFGGCFAIRCRAQITKEGAVPVDVDTLPGFDAKEVRAGFAWRC